MTSMENAVAETLEDLDIAAFIESHIEELVPHLLYYVTFQEKANGNNKVVARVEYTHEGNDVLDDNMWVGDVDVKIVEIHGMTPLSAHLLIESFSLMLDAEYFDSDSESEDDSDDETLSLDSEPRTPPPRFSRSLTLPPPLRRRR